MNTTAGPHKVSLLAKMCLRTDTAVLFSRQNTGDPGNILRNKYSRGICMINLVMMKKHQVILSIGCICVTVQPKSHQWRKERKIYDHPTHPDAEHGSIAFLISVSGLSLICQISKAVDLCRGQEQISYCTRKYLLFCHLLVLHLWGNVYPRTYML